MCRLRLGGRRAFDRGEGICLVFDLSAGSSDCTDTIASPYFFFLFLSYG